MVDMAIAEEAAAAITAKAIAMCEQADAATRARSVAAAKVTVGDSARLVGQQCVQLHGGMGLTEEYPASHYFARLGMFERLFGCREEHVQRIVTLGQ
jgi:alkylation response protein AidB-like acyl-CoA dehydrogenase